jgi:hypothetical protein
LTRRAHSNLGLRRIPSSESALGGLSPVCICWEIGRSSFSLAFVCILSQRLCLDAFLVVYHLPPNGDYWNAPINSNLPMKWWQFSYFLFFQLKMMFGSRPNNITKKLITGLFELIIFFSGKRIISVFECIYYDPLKFQQKSGTARGLQLCNCMLLLFKNWPRKQKPNFIHHMMWKYVCMSAANKSQCRVFTTMKIGTNIKCNQLGKAEHCDHIFSLAAVCLSRPHAEHASDAAQYQQFLSLKNQ